MNKDVEIEIAAVRFADGPGKIKAYYTVRIGSWVIHEWRVIKETGKPPWVAYPTVGWKDKDGRWRYQAVVDLPSGLKQRVDIAILTSWEVDKSHASVQK